MTDDKKITLPTAWTSSVRLAELLGVTRQAIHLASTRGGCVAGLGYVERTRDADDKLRVRLVAGKPKATGRPRAGAVKRPDDAQLMELVREHGAKRAAFLLGVNSALVRRWMREAVRAV